MPDVTVPDDIQSALDADPAAKQRFAKLPASHRGEYLKWVLEAKKPETRVRRIRGVLERLNAAPSP